jgi:hypothetical protein
VKTLTAFCDLAYCPVSFDFVTWLVRAMKERDAIGCSGLHVVIMPKEDGVGGFARDWGKHDEAAARWRLWHIVMASIPLAGATVTLAHDRDLAGWIERGCDDHDLVAEEHMEPVWRPEGKAHFMGPLVEASRKGESIPKLQATAGARRYVEQWIGSFGSVKPIVTLTTRNQDTDPDRNTNQKAWGDFQTWLETEGYRPIVISDSNLALARGRGYAELDPDLRLALYERAKMNLIGNNGPQELLKFSDAPYLAFGQALTAGWREHFKKYFHMEPGDQLPWARADQRLVYKADHFETLKEEFQKWAWSKQQ